jgi:hypothetical protein
MLLSVACEAGESDLDLEPEHRGAQEENEDSSASVVYSISILRSPDGDVLHVDEQGAWTPDLAERVARPWLHVSEGVVHDDEAWHHENPDGTTEAGYRVTATSVSPLEPGPAALVAPLSAEVVAVLATLDAATEVRTMIAEGSPHFGAVA